MAGGNAWTGGWCRIRNIVELHFRKGGATIQNSSPSQLNFNEFDNVFAGNIKITGEMKGARLLLSGGYDSSITSTTSLNQAHVNSATDYNYIMSRAGSITDLSVFFRITAITTPGDVRIGVFKNNVEVFSKIFTIQPNGLPQHKHGYKTQNRNFDTFEAGDGIRLVFTFDTFAGSINKIIALCGIQFDT